MSRGRSAAKEIGSLLHWGDSMLVCHRAFGAVLFVAALVVSSSAHAGYYTCEGNARYVNGHCSDGSMAIYHADTVKPYRSQPVTPDRGQGDGGNYNGGSGGSNDGGYGSGDDRNRHYRRGWGNGRGDDEGRSYDRRDDRGWQRDSRDGYGSHRSGAMEELFGAWSTNVAGAVWTSPSDVPGWSTLHVSPGALAGLLVIYPDGRYIWNSYGGKRGKWRATGDSGYPIQLIDNVEHRLWNVGLDDRHPGHIYINESHGYYYYTGRRP